MDLVEEFKAFALGMGYAPDTLRDYFDDFADSPDDLDD